MKISQIIIPAAGIGTRFLPITKTIPKEMIPLSNKPAIQYIIEEAAASEIKNIIICTSKKKSIIKDYFSNDKKLEEYLIKENKIKYLEELNTLIKNLNWNYVIQKSPNGLADAILRAKNLITQDFFAVALPDDIVFGEKPELSNLLNINYEKNCSVIALEKVNNADISKYGIIKIKKQITTTTFELESITEKPKAELAPSNLAITGRYIFNSNIFNFIKKTKKFNNKEILLTDTINLMIKNNYKFIGKIITGKRFDIGTPTGFFNYINSQIK